MEYLLCPVKIAVELKHQIQLLTREQEQEQEKKHGLNEHRKEKVKVLPLLN
jgi:hypothetical protein